MPCRHSLRSMLGVAVCSLSVAAVACGGRGELDTDVTAYNVEDASSLPPGPGEDAGAPFGDAGKPGTVDAGKDSGLPGIPGFPGLPGLPGFPGIPGLDAGALGACFDCARTNCDSQGSACLSNPTCIQQGFCEVTTCLGGTTPTGGGTGFGGLDLACFMKCGSDQKATQELTSALTCVLAACGSQCLSAATSLGGAGGGLGGLGLGGLPAGL